jgi:hypothetical protein
MDVTSRDAMFSDAASNLPTRRVGEACDIAMAINNKYMTGSVVDVDSGALVN